jgi:hypothetical protein
MGRIITNKPEIIEYIKLHAGKKSPTEMANKFNLNSSVIHSYANKISVSLELETTKKRRKKIYDFLSKYGTKYTGPEVAKKLRKFGVSQNMVYAAARHKGLPIKPVDKNREVFAGNGFFNVRAHENWII